MEKGGSMTIKEADKHILGEVISEDLAKFVTEMGSGSHELRKKIRFMLPNNELFIGCLFPLKQSEEEPEENEEMSVSDSSQNTELGGKDTSDLLSTLRKPSSISINFITQDKGKIELKSFISVYVRIKPDINDYKDHLSKDREDGWNINDFIEKNSDIIKTVEHPTIWKRVDIILPTINFNLAEALKDGEISKEFDLFNYVKKIIKTDVLYCKPENDLDINLLKKGNKNAFDNFWKNVSNRSEIERESLDWKIEISIKNEGLLPGYKNKKSRLFTIILTNVTDFSEKANYDLKYIFEPVLYDSKMHVFLKDIKLEKTENKWQYDLPYSKQITGGKIPKSFDINYDIYTWGNGCYPIYNLSKKEIVTNITTICSIQRDRPIDAQDIPSLKFCNLSNKSDKEIIGNLKDIKKYLEGFIEVYNLESNNEKSKLDFKQFELIFNRFNEGMEYLSSDPKAIMAFRCMNRTYDCAYSKPNIEAGWRLFQLVFIVGNVKRAFLNNEASDENEDAELLFVATGGGKTESYVGLTIALLFFQRLSGQKYGIATWVKFPLRLLALDQFDRLTNIIIWADYVRKKEGISGEPFSLGFFVGNDEQYPAMVSELVMEKMGDPRKIKIFSINKGNTSADGGVLEECPICKKNGKIHDIEIKKELLKIAGDYRWEYDAKQHRVRHWCEECGNEFFLYVTDEEIFRYLPSILVSTVDKLAVAAWNPFFASILGIPLYYCKNHGFSVTPKNCSIMDKRCGNKISSAFGNSSSNRSFNRRGRPFDGAFANYSCSNNNLELFKSTNHAPIIIAQDELHLLKENLGTIDSYFETLVDNIIYHNCKRHPKYIAMSATLAGTRKQVGLLYLRGTTLWPGDAPSDSPLKRPEKDAFFEHINATHRFYVGIMPHGKSPDFASYRSLQYCWIRIQEFLNDTSIIRKNKNINGLLKSISDEELKKFIFDYYKKSFVYQGRKIGTHNFTSSIDRIVNDDLTTSTPKYDPIICDAITGDNSMEEIRNYRRRMNIAGDLDTLISTSLISHGVDISNVNQMFFQGIPDLTAEFIQASSRIGRKYPGLVFVSFYPSRSRDLQLSSSFEMYLDTIKYWIESVPMARWCKEALREIFTTAICFTLCTYGQQLLGGQERIERSWPISIYQLGDPNEGKPGFLTWSIKIPDFDGKLKKFIKEGLALTPNDFIKKQAPDDLLPIKVINNLEYNFELLYDRFTRELMQKIQKPIRSYYKTGLLAHFLKEKLGSTKDGEGNPNEEFVASWFSCMAGLRGIQEPVVIKPSFSSESYLTGGRD